MSGLCFVTDQKAGEPDILSLSKSDPLVVRDLRGNLIISIPAPADGWTHDALVAQSEVLAMQTAGGADAYLGTEWVGSTEV